MWNLKKAEYIEAKSRMTVTRGEKVEGKGRCWSKGTKLQLRSMTAVNDSIVHWKLAKGVDFRYSHHK